MPALDLYVVTCERREAKNSKPYYDLRVRKPNDVEGQKDFGAKVWSEAIAKSKNVEIDAGRIISAVYEQRDFNGQPQLIIEKYQLRPPETNTERFRPPPAVDQEATFRKFFDYPFKDPHIAQFMKNLEKAISNGSKSIKKRLYEVPAGAKNHHPRRAGLLQHVEEMWDIATRLVGERGIPHFEGLLDLDMLLVGIFLHDLGKTQEYNPETLSYEATRVGAYIGHVTLGALIIRQAWPDDAPHEKMLKLMHIVLSHHGALDCGSPVVPLVPEAHILHLVDAMSARLDVSRTAAQNSEQGIAPEFSKTVRGTPITPQFPPKS
jgi:3'-5' exoribonuclease